MPLNIDPVADDLPEAGFWSNDTAFLRSHSPSTQHMQSLVLLSNLVRRLGTTAGKGWGRIGCLAAKFIDGIPMTDAHW